MDVNANQTAFSPANTLQVAQQFVLADKCLMYFFNGKYNNLLDLLRKETLYRFNSELGQIIASGIPSQVKDLIPKLSDLFK